MRQQGYHGSCRKCRAAGSQYGQDGLQLCLHHDVVTPQPERYSISLASMPGRWDSHRYGAMLPQEHNVVADMSFLHKYVHEGYSRGCRDCRVTGSQYAKKVCLRQQPGNVESDVNEGVEAFKRTIANRVHMLSPTICFQPREDI